LGDFQFGLFRSAIGYRIQVIRLISHDHIAQCHAGRTRASLKKPHVGRIRTSNAIQLTLCLGVGDGASQLGCQGEQEGYFVIFKLTRLTLAHHQYTQNLPVLDNRNTEETMIGDLAGIGDKQVTRMAGGIIQVNRFSALTNQPDEAPVHWQSDLSHRLPAQSVGSAQHMVSHFVISEIDRADIGFYGKFNLPHDHLQRAIQIRCAVHLLDDSVKNFKHYYL